MTEELAEVTDVHDEPIEEQAEQARNLPAVVEHAPMTLFGTDDPVAVVEKATLVAKALADVIETQQLFTMIQNRRHIKVEGWTLLGSMLGVFPETEWTRPTKDSKGADAWEARVVARTRDGAIVGSREGMCSRSESKWKNRDDYAIRSMAQTRAVSGALAQCLRFIVVLAGFEGTPDAEMPRSDREGETRREESAGRGAKTPGSWAEIKAVLKQELGEKEAVVWFDQAAEAASGGKLPVPTPYQRMQGVCVDLLEQDGEWRLRPDAREAIQRVFAGRLDGIMLEGPEWALTPTEAETRPQAE